MHESPFRFRIGTSQDRDPSVITVIGDGIHSGQTGQTSEFIISTYNAGMGFLQIRIDGPSKVALNACEMDYSLFSCHFCLSFVKVLIFFFFHVEQGYKVCYIALAPGVYYVTVKYSGIHIPGSPFKVVMEGKKLGGGEPNTSFIKIDAIAKVSKKIAEEVPVFSGDANKVMVRGPGLNKFFPGQSATFNIDTGLAGDNVLYVGLLTSKGPCEEITLEYLGNGQYVVKYLVQEEVKGFIFIKYGDLNVPGSPFAISF
ncbi:unnamed protein product [Onchocerca ochengi]|uniref:Filamin-A n=1 Tax=Onchocerca ochengi TaxID=42157 RepID=A0A182EAB1_ONCOC|nr:unnamed protein product [Onchocerca ochengi]